jgi:release factor glutamine methyltransferase
VSGASAPSTLSVIEALRRAAAHLAERGITAARLEAELMLAHVLGLTRLELYLHFDRPLSQDERSAMRRLLTERGRGVPLAYLTGKREFFSLEFEVSSAVMVPRPETELLVEAVLGLERDERLPAGEILDVGTGAGAIAVALAHRLPARRVVATDISPDALAVAARNARRHGIAGRVTFTEGDLNAGQTGPFAAVVSNPPYIAEGDRGTLPPEVLAEPPLALFAGEAGLTVIRRLIGTCPGLLAPGGWLLLEVGAGQAGEVERLMRDEGRLVEMVVGRDLAGIERMVAGQLPLR